jgi:hypothetical protein
MFSVMVFSQTAADVFKPGSYTFYWLGLDFSHLKLIGDFTQFGEAGSIDPYQIKTQYFPGWNNLMLNEPEKYDFKGMFQFNELVNDIEMITKINAETDVNTMEGSSAPNYSLENIQSFVSSYNTAGKSGIGIVFIAEVFDKNTPEAWFHVVAINASSKEVLVWERIKAKPGGFGLRNYWAAAVYNIIKEGKKSYYKSWKAKYTK